MDRWEKSAIFSVHHLMIRLMVLDTAYITWWGIFPSRRWIFTQLTLGYLHLIICHLILQCPPYRLHGVSTIGLDQCHNSDHHRIIRSVAPMLHHIIYWPWSSRSSTMLALWCALDDSQCDSSLHHIIWWAVFLSDLLDSTIWPDRLDQMIKWMF